MKKLLVAVVLAMLLTGNSFSFTKCQGDNVFEWTDCIGAYIIVDGDYKAIEFNPGDEKRLLNPSFEEIQNFNFGTKYIGEMKLLNMYWLISSSLSFLSCPSFPYHLGLTLGRFPDHLQA